ncbi:glycoside hydrolase family 2 protein [Actinacidiphila bryophytorum]|uniref:beta-mannosidase n=1 Tax=Actinacidiphila bryophytorum TaxID=1436133 RepID=A0A9W4H8T6_9ACTN|nr:glycoside hydrolase family 2 protein [Actinacidiphila bryophytorum]MBM9440235.1 glycoside hydrolase family 2 protein [Actinacidiphila bryophytorum]MBN6545582.1 glycoside hydrolase family 2 protein [Actinacidiphila bryophytorum]CAG7658396.1 Beta-mannosidase [Actinacidiphila bryophytorum]
MKDVTPVVDGWKLRLPGGGTGAGPGDGPLGPGTAGGQDTVAAAVPGCVHTDLLAAGLLADPFLDRNEQDAAWVGRTDWTYETALPAHTTGHERSDLVFDGLDTVAEITLGGRRLGATRNMHRSHRFDVTADRSAIAGTALTVAFTSAYTEAERVRSLVGERPNSYPEPFQYIRKMACSFGWDWGPTLVTAGIWKPVRLEHWSTARLAGVTPQVTVAAGTGRVEAGIVLERTAAGAGRPLTIRLRVGETVTETAVPAEADRATAVAEIADPDLWWPHGYGRQPLYDCEVTLLDPAAPAGELDRWQRRVGFRTVTLDTSPDEHGTAFTLAVNGTPVFARGVNWIPDDALPTRIDAARYRRRLQQAVDAGVDLVRVWGGGIYESDDFYDACDELGLLVWQDFLFACAAYPEEQPLRSEIEAEARENVARLAPHPSLALWNGNNENLWGFRDWEWEDALAGDSWGEGYYLGLLARVVAETDPTRPYWAGSPWSGSWDHHPNDPRHGTAHSWEVWNRTDYTDYRDSVPRFVAEFGWQAPPAYATARRAVSDDPLTPDSPGMLHHQKAADGNGKLTRGLARHFPLPADFDTWHYLTQVNQARAVATGIEHWRSHWPVCAGTVVWQLNDCWPVTSWAAVDGDERPKPLYHELKRLYADRLVTVQPRPDGLVAALVNQTAQDWTGTAVLCRVAVDGAVLAEVRLPFTAAPRTVAEVALPAQVLPADGSGKELLTVRAGELRAFWFPVRDKDFGYPEPGWDLDLAVHPDGSAAVTVTARTLLRDLLLQADRLGPGVTADTGLTTLLPGESVTITVRGWEVPSSDAAAAALYCVNTAVREGDAGVAL